MRYVSMGFEGVIDGNFWVLDDLTSCTGCIVGKSPAILVE